MIYYPQNDFGPLIKGMDIGGLGIFHVFLAQFAIGVAMWFTTIQISPRTIGTMVDAFHWIWAREWTYFCLEIVAGYAFYRYAPKPSTSPSSTSNMARPRRSAAGGSSCFSSL